MDVFFHGAASWLQPLADANLGDFVFFKLVNDYFNREIQEFGLDLMGRAMRWVSTIALTITTLWILILGYRIATGQSRESAMATMIKAGKVALVISFASALGANGAMLHQSMTQNLDKEIHRLFTGDEGTAADAIDENLAYTQVAMATLDAVRVDPSQPEVLEKKGRAMLMAGFGTASPPMAAGAMLLLFKFTMAFLIGIGPIFILALVFDQTKDLFKKWLFYVIGTLFSMSMLSVVTAMVLKFTAKVAAAYWAVKFIPLVSAEGLSSQALQQGGIGLIMTMLIITVPTIAAALWQGNMGTFLSYTAFNSAASPGPQGQPAGSYMPQQAPRNNSQGDERSTETANATKAIAGSSTPTYTQAPGSRGNASRSEGSAT
ncbi:type IV secretion system protein [Xanthomonas cannabis]|uniref:Type IV secretion system protein VirB6 n=1 Tax=Xanthomonas cannabis TaxID=1885674 RepID=A0ABR6JFM9_9XANT|nr:type IV secretion system protein [Xanthomonas cannabis]MBB4591607.1 type IV secretion system protein VirB6 [Xanthomonas cannabis]MBB5521179.1 type IV secretion system protein VirB6 [Xanthomonas cannabis]